MVGVPVVREGGISRTAPDSRGGTVRLPRRREDIPLVRGIVAGGVRWAWVGLGLWVCAGPVGLVAQFPAPLETGVCGPGRAWPPGPPKKQVPASHEAGTRLKLVQREPRWSYFVQPSSPEVCRVAQALAAVALFTATMGV
ncbi:hypothetical protein GCM10010306_007160 [Streptomyces umbrinus]|nr:hypothetical protein GCM10010306_007160 [Streptomyces umbrinus]